MGKVEQVVAVVGIGIVLGTEPEARMNDVPGNGIDFVKIDPCADSVSSTNETIKAFQTICLPSETVGDRLCESLAERTEMEIGDQLGICKDRDHRT